MSEGTPVAVVTGGSAGIGAAVSLELESRGYMVIIADVQSPLEDPTASRTWFQCDVTSDEDWAALKEHISSTFGRCDVVVNNAYAILRKPAHVMEPSEWRYQQDVLVGQVHRSLYYLHDLLTCGHLPSIINISSVHSRLTDPLHSAYAAAKGAVEAVTRQLAVEYGPWLRVNCVVPGAILTDAWSGFDEKVLAEVASRSPLKRMGTPADIAKVVGFLVSTDAAFVTGAALVVDGGWTLSKALSL